MNHVNAPHSEDSHARWSCVGWSMCEHTVQFDTQEFDVAMGIVSWSGQSCYQACIYIGTIYGHGQVSKMSLQLRGAWQTQ